MSGVDPDYELAGSKRRAPKIQQRERIDVDRARRLYDKIGTWRGVAEFLRRKDGTAFQPNSIYLAVRWADLGYAGSIIFVKGLPLTSGGDIP